MGLLLQDVLRELARNPAYVVEIEQDTTVLPAGVSELVDQKQLERPAALTWTLPPERARAGALTWNQRVATIIAGGKRYTVRYQKPHDAAL